MATETVTLATDRSDGGARALLTRIAAELDTRSSTAQVFIEMLEDIEAEPRTRDRDPGDPRDPSQQTLALIEGIRGQLQQLRCLVKDIDQFQAQEVARAPRS